MFYGWYHPLIEFKTECRDDRVTPLWHPDVLILQPARDGNGFCEWKFKGYEGSIYINITFIAVSILQIEIGLKGLEIAIALINIHKLNVKKRVRKIIEKGRYDSNAFARNQYTYSRQLNNTRIAASWYSACNTTLKGVTVFFTCR